MSEVKGTLLTIILALAVFGTVFGLITGAIERKANNISSKIDEAGVTGAAAAAPAATSVVGYHY